MGYRSDVAFTLTIDGYDPRNDEDYANFKKMLGFFKLSDFYNIVTQPDYDCVKSKELGWSWRDGAITFHVTGWKWYNGFKCVEAFDALWAQFEDLSNEGIPMSGYFMRSGEEMDDNDQNDFGEAPDWDMAYVSKIFDFQRSDYLGVTDSEKGTDEQVQTDVGQLLETGVWTNPNGKAA